MSELDLTKPVQTRQGSKVTILKTDVRHPKFPIIAVVDEGEHQHSISYTAEGKYYTSYHASSYDLVNVPEVTTQYCNLYSLMNSTFHGEKRLADANQSKVQDRIACLKFTKTDGVITDVSLA